MIDAIQNAIDTGMQLMDKYFEKISYELSDSEDETEEVQKGWEVQTNFIFFFFSVNIWFNQNELMYKLTIAASFFGQKTHMNTDHCLT